jgi:hypothetical protein
MQKYLIVHHGFNEQDMAILIDDGKHALPTKGNIEMAFELMANHSDSGDVVFVHYSGHGKQFKDLDGTFHSSFCVCLNCLLLRRYISFCHFHAYLSIRFMKGTKKTVLMKQYYLVILKQLGPF